MNTKPKKCKGINKARGFDGCGVETLNRKNGLCPSCLYEWYTTTELGKIMYNKQFLPKVKQVVERRNKSEKKALKDSLKTLKQYEAEAKKSFQQWIRLRDKDLPCISCGEFHKDLWDGGHYFKAELYSGLIFDERNVHKQCRRCNRFQGGNEIQYRLGLVERFGSEFVDQLEKDSINKRVYKFTKQELIAKKLQYDIKIKEILK